MIEIIDKHSCCGCSSCVQKCPKKCISMYEDDEVWGTERNVY